ncbi:MAG TPA: cytochrome c oxidase accessory protein CcoG [bacterium]|jgi:cytochrome c oxidase accessory protein FixG
MDSHALHPPDLSVTIGEHGRRKWVYSDVAHGRFTRARTILYSVLVLFYVAAPWLSIAGQPFLRFDIPARRYSIIGMTFVPTDLYLLALFLLLAALGMFFFSALLGRLWCGWTCPQTVYLDGVFRRIERWIEGTPLQRRKLDNGPHDDTYWAKKLAKHTLFGAFSLFLSLSFTAYFVGPQASFGMVLGSVAGHSAALITALIIAAASYANFAWFREQFCTFLCPYARFQSVMLDDHSLIVGYDPQRGEPRGMLRPTDLASRGDCIDCKRCVQVCPTGIDIRDGLQLECISCTACIDACDTVMDRIGKPRGLVRYDSLAGIARKPRRVIRARVLLYAVVMAVLLVGFITRLSSREAVALTVARAPGLPYLAQNDGKVRNTFNLYITNTEAHSETVTVSVIGPAGVDLLVPGQPFEVGGGERINAEAFVMLPAAQIRSSETPLTFRLTQGDNLLSTQPAVFLGPIHSTAK